MLPNAELAIVEPAKVRDYLLSASHPVGRFKAAVFFALRYGADEWQLLQRDLLSLARTGEARLGQDGPYGQKYEVSGILRGPSGRQAIFTTVWLVAAGSGVPRFVIAFPG